MENLQPTILLHPPTFNFFDWRVLEASFFEESPSRHLVGRTENNTRVSSRIFEIDTVMRSCMTQSCNVYMLVGSPGQGVDGELAALWEMWAIRNGVVSVNDVTDEVLAKFRQADEELGFCSESIPGGFPQDWRTGAVSGTQMKFLARKIGGHYLVGPTQDELKERYELCRRLSAQYFRLHLHTSEASSQGNAFVLPLPNAFVYDALQGWDLSAGERKWIVDRIESMKR